MKKLLSLIPAIFVGAALAFGLNACSTTQQANAQQALAKLQTTVVNGCMVVQPVLASVALLDPTVGAAATANGLFCATASAITVTSVQSAISTGLPAISTAINTSTLVPADKKPLVTGAVAIFQLLLTNALTVYGQAAPVTVPVTSPIPASAPVAASS